MSEQEEQRLAISYGWLVQVVNRHTCGTGPGGHYGAHEPGCGTIPICPLSEIEGIAAHDRQVKAEAWDEGYSWGWSDAQEAHDVRQEMDRSEWRLSMPNPYRIESEARP